MPKTKAAKKPATPAKPQTKQAQMIALLSREEGATLADLIEITQWKPHSIRGHLSNMRSKKQMNITVTLNPEGKRVYQLTPDAPQK